MKSKDKSKRRKSFLSSRKVGYVFPRLFGRTDAEHDSLNIENEVDFEWELTSVDKVRFI